MSDTYAFSYVRATADGSGWDVQLSTDSEAFPGLVLAFCYFALGCGFAPETIAEYVPDWQNIDPS